MPQCGMLPMDIVVLGRAPTEKTPPKDWLSHVAIAQTGGITGPRGFGAHALPVASQSQSGPLSLSSTIAQAELRILAA